MNSTPLLWDLPMFKGENTFRKTVILSCTMRKRVKYGCRRIYIFPVVSMLHPTNQMHAWEKTALQLLKSSLFKSFFLWSSMHSLFFYSLLFQPMIPFGLHCPPKLSRASPFVKQKLIRKLKYTSICKSRFFLLIRKTKWRPDSLTKESITHKRTVDTF